MVWYGYVAVRNTTRLTACAEYMTLTHEIQARYTLTHNVNVTDFDLAPPPLE